jgi:hypothetical protein
MVVFHFRTKSMYAHEVQLTQIAKRDQIVAIATKDVAIGSHIFINEGQEIQCSGHWDSNGAVYCEIMECKFQPNYVGKDVVLHPNDFNIWVLVKFGK